MIKKYYRLTKPGIIYGNLISCAAGFLLASVHSLNLPLLSATLLGTSLVIASGCVFNNYFDRDIDKKMARTKKRALVIRTIPSRDALIFASLLLIAGFAILSAFTNLLVVVIGTVGFIDYVFLYTFSKRYSVHSTLIGSISGATPIVAGYCAAAGQFDTAAILLWLVMTAWQMPHTYAMAIRRHDDYKAASVPILPVIKGVRTAKLHTMAWIVVFIAATSLLTVFGYTGWIYLLVVLTVSLYWFTKGLRFYSADNTVWGKKMFLTSLVVLLTLSVMLSVGALLT
ncbi:MAG: heme o synthase [Candidatus Saccharimonadales bacterium]